VIRGSTSHILDLRRRTRSCAGPCRGPHRVRGSGSIPTRSSPARTSRIATDGTIAALDAIEKATGAKDVNAIGYCLGGAARPTLGYRREEEGEAHRQRDVRDSWSISRAPASSGLHRRGAGRLARAQDARRGYLEGTEMANVQHAAPNDLIWSFVINNYLLGRDPFPFDLLHWNCDATRMPARCFYLRNMYMRNALKDKGGITSTACRSTAHLQGADLLRLGDRGPSRRGRRPTRNADPRQPVAFDMGSGMLT
jgi:hypothetical protein